MSSNTNNLEQRVNSLAKEIPDANIEYFDHPPTESEIPAKMQNLFVNRPHPLAILAARQLQERLNQAPLLSKALMGVGNGKMFGVLVVADSSGQCGYLYSFSGMLNQQWLVPGFVPPVFNIAEQSAFLADGELRLEALSTAIDNLTDNPERYKAKRQLSELKLKCEQELFTFKQSNQENKRARRIARETMETDDIHLRHSLSLASQHDKKAYRQLKTEWDEKLQALQQKIDRDYDNEIIRLKTESRQLSKQLHSRVFETYRLTNKSGESASIKSLFAGKTPPGGTGDCAAPKLLQFAFKNHLKPLALAEFWYGGSPTDGVRHHGEFYLPCRGKCQPVLPFMLKGLGIESEPRINTEKHLVPNIIYEDADIVVVDKPAGLLSIPGKVESSSVSSWLANRYPHATGPLLVHRLDMDTSGLLLAAKNSPAHKKLQMQFMQRRVEKRYVAVLSKPVEPAVKTIDLPLRVDLDDRPRQMVCYRHGKKAVTGVEVISTDCETSRVYFSPVTGRTHQLRVHAAHSLGLSAPIVGDALYGVRSDRMLLHAERLSFNHPSSGKRMRLKVEAPF